MGATSFRTHALGVKAQYFAFHHHLTVGWELWRVSLFAMTRPVCGLGPPQASTPVRVRDGVLSQLSKEDFGYLPFAEVVFWF